MEYDSAMQMNQLLYSRTTHKPAIVFSYTHVHKNIESLNNKKNLVRGL